MVAGLFFALFFGWKNVAAVEVYDYFEAVEPMSSEDSLQYTQEVEAFLDKGMEAYQSGKIALAITHWKHAEDTANKLRNHFLKVPLYIAAIDLLGVAYEAQGDLGKALQYMLHALQTRKMDPDVSPDEMAYSYNNIGAVYFSLTDWETAERYYGESQRLYFEAKLPLEAAWPMTNQGLSHLRNEKFQDAVAIFQNAESLVLKNKAPELTASLYNNWALALIQIGKIPDGIALLEKLIKNPKSPAKQQKIAAANLGFAYLQDKKYNKAIEWLDKALKTDLLSQQHSGKVHVHRSEAFFGLEDFAQAEMAADQGIRLLIGLKADEAVKGKSRTHPALDQRTLVQLLNAKANALASQNERAAAMEIYEEAFDAIDQMRSGIHANGSKLFLSKFAHPIYDAALTNAWKARIKEEYLDFGKILNIFQRNKSILLQEELQTNNALKLAKVPRIFRERLRTLQYEREYLQQKVIAAERNEDAKQAEALRKQLFIASEDLERMEKNLETDFSSLRAAKPDLSLPSYQMFVDQMRAEKAKYFTYFVGERFVFGLSVNENSGNWRMLEYRDIIEREVNEFTRACTDWNWVIAYPDSATAVIREIGPSLYQHLLGYFLLPSQLKGPPLKLKISPDGFLGRLPFEALLTEKPEYLDGISQFKWLLHDADIQYEWSAGKSPSPQTPKRKKEVLAMAPMLGGQAGKLRGLNAKGLPGTAKELEGIAAHFEGRFLLGDSASKSEFLKLAPDYEVLHLAMHGFDDLENSALSRLDFANQESLLAWEISNLDLESEMVVLSACETGTGQIAKGEGVLSLGRSFISAGAKSVVMSLWKLEDAASSEIMSSFYAELKKGEGKAAALRIAKQNYLSQADDFAAQPAFWAGLVLMGDDAPISMAEGSGFGSKAFNFKMILVLCFFALIALIVGRFFMKRKSYGPQE